MINLQNENLVGSFLMIIAMAAFSIEDSLIKIISEKLPVSQILLILGLGGALVFAITGAIKKERMLLPEVLSHSMNLRVITEVIGRVCYSLSLALTSLSSTTIILQATPIVVVAGASIFFQEKVSLLRWLAVLTGMLGVLIIVQPGAESFSIFSMLAVLGMAGFAARDLASRAAPKSLGIFTLGLHGFLSLSLAGILLSFFSKHSFIWPDIITATYLFAAIIVGAIGYGGLIKAMRLGEVSAITPFRYSRLIFGISIGVFIFGERLDFSTILGCAIIVASSFFVVWSSRDKRYLEKK
jgi:drug/metabolite transporter (DMT)-like permease